MYKASYKCLTKFIKIRLSLFESLVVSVKLGPHYREGWAATFRFQAYKNKFSSSIA